MIQTQKIPFPIKGLNVIAAHEGQVVNTTPSARNVRTFDSDEGRARGGQRAGMKHFGSYNTGTITVSSGVVTLTGGTFPSWSQPSPGTIPELAVGGTNYEIATLDTSTQVTLKDISLNVATASAYEVHPGPVTRTIATAGVQDINHISATAKAHDTDYVCFAGRQGTDDLWPYGFANSAGRVVGHASLAVATAGTEQYLNSCWDFEGWCYIATASSSSADIAYIYRDRPTWTEGYDPQWRIEVSGLTVSATNWTGVAGMVAPGDGILYVWFTDVDSESGKSGLYRFYTSDGSAVSTNPWKSEDSNELLNAKSGVMNNASGTRITFAKNMLAFSAGHLYFLGTDRASGVNLKLHIMDLNGNSINEVDVQCAQSDYGTGNVIDLAVDDNGNAYTVTSTSKTTAIATQAASFDKLGSMRWMADNGVGVPVSITPTLWLDASDPLSFDKDSSGVVSRWDDKSGNGNHAIMATAANRPTWNDDTFNGGGTVTFDGVDDALQITTNGRDIARFSDLCSDADNWFMCAVVNVTAVTTNAATIHENDTIIRAGSEAGLVLKDDGAGNITAHAFNDDGSVASASTAISEGNSKTTKYILIAQNDDTNVSVSENDTAAVPTPTGTTAPTTGEFWIGKDSAGGYANFNLSELMVFNSTPDPTERASIIKTLAHKWGIDSPGPTTGGVKSIAYDPIFDVIRGTGDEVFEHSGKDSTSIVAATGVASNNTTYGTGWDVIRTIKGGADTGDSTCGYVLGKNLSGVNLKVVDIDPSVTKSYTSPDDITQADQGRPLSTSYPFITPAWGRHSTRRSIILVTVGAGDVKSWADGFPRTVPSGLDAISPGARQVFSIQNIGPNGLSLFYADGASTVYYDPYVDSMQTWTPTAGTLPVDSDGNRCNLIEGWRGRVCMSGLPGDPTNWFFSKINDSLDWDYSANVCEDIAVSGNNAEVNKVPDIVTGMIPWTNDLLIFGGDQTMWIMRGDPMAGGRIDNISLITGMAWGRAWCIDPIGNVYFFGSRGGVYRIQRGMDPSPQKMTASSIDEKWADLDLAKHQIRMTWDDRLIGFNVWVTPQGSEAATQNYFYDMRAEAWWEDDFQETGHQPTAVHVYDGDSTGDRSILLGGWDGRMRLIDYDGKSDATKAISSYVYMGPFGSPNGGGVSIDTLQGTMDNTADATTVEIMRGSHAEAALAARAAVSAKWGAGRSRKLRRPVRGNSLYVKLSNSTADAAWQLEQIEVGMKPMKGQARFS